MVGHAEKRKRPREEYFRGRSSPDTRVDRSTVYLQAQKRRPAPPEICNDLRRRHCEKGWIGLSNEALTERIRQEMKDAR
jgi:hypothetical protein